MPQDVSLGDVSGMFIWEDPQGRPRSCWRDHISGLDWDHLGIPPEELVEAAVETRAGLFP